MLVEFVNFYPSYDLTIECEDIWTQGKMTLYELACRSVYSRIHSISS